MAQAIQEFDGTDSSRESVADWIYHQLRNEIFSRTLPAGERLSVPAIAERFNVSRSPVREAVLRLVQKEFAVEERNKGATVAVIRIEDMQPLYQVREVLEGLAAGLAAKKATREQLGQLQRNLLMHTEAVSTEQLEDHIKLDLEFHGLITTASCNSVLEAQLGRIHQKIRLGMQEAGQAGAEIALKEHAIILQSILAGDIEAAEIAARAHIRRVTYDLFSSE